VTILLGYSLLTTYNISVFLETETETETKERQIMHKLIDTVDLHVGKRIRLRRKQLNLSQSDLGVQVKVKFQQIQKYETGANRVSCSKLWYIAQALHVPMSYFFFGLEGESEGIEIPTPEHARVMEMVASLDLEDVRFTGRFIGKITK